ncbi:hypothetical protein [Acinetobacter sp.]|uniref:hypothetical protein n=1 Tax=Acinetobacter sp. TaxID=472 RepID=UPI0031DFCE8A
MKNLLLVVAMLSGLGLTGCAVYTPGGGSLVVDPDGRYSDGHGNGHGNFCPPGQAKKGNC